MKYFLAVILTIGLLFTVSYAAEKLELKNQKDKESYSLGYRFGDSLKAQHLELNLNAYTSGIKD